jgi:hypothetical protein
MYTPPPKKDLFKRWNAFINYEIAKAKKKVCVSVNILDWKKWFYIWYMALAWWLVPCLPFPGLPHIYFLFTMRLTNERVGVFLAWRSVQHLDFLSRYKNSLLLCIWTLGRRIHSNLLILKKSRCCTLRHAKNTPTRSFVSRMVNRK